MRLIKLAEGSGNVWINPNEVRAIVESKGESYCYITLYLSIGMTYSSQESAENFISRIEELEK